MMDIMDKLSNAKFGIYILTQFDAQEALRVIKHPYIYDNENPFVEYQDVLLDGGYSASEALQDVVLNCFNSHVQEVRLEAIRSFDARHLMIFHKVLDHYARYGEDCPAFWSVATAIREQRKK